MIYSIDHYSNYDVAGIAQVTAEKGFTVLLKDKDNAGIARGSSYIQENWDKKAKKKRMTVG